MCLPNIFIRHPADIFLHSPLDNHKVSLYTLHYMNNILDTIKSKKPLSLNITNNLSEWFKVELTYTSNAIEGNTLSRAETNLVINNNQTIGNKTIQEHLEAINHAQAFDYILSLIKTSKNDITQKTILNIHQKILQKIDDTNSGRFRTVSVRIAGSRVILPNATKVPKLMDEFISWLHTSDIDTPTLAVQAHLKLVSIHPFVDGNGRTARLLMNLILLQSGYPPAVISKEDRQTYLSSIEKVQLGGSSTQYFNFMYQAINKSLDTYIDSVSDKQQKQILNEKNLLKIGELSKITSESVPTIRYWTNEKLIAVESYTEAGYQLYNQNTVSLISKIRQLQKEKRMTLNEIKKIML